MIVPPQLVRGEQRQQLRREADGQPLVEPHGQHRVLRRLVPLLPRLVKMPRPGHPHVRMQGAPAGKVHHHILPARLDPRNRLPDDRAHLKQRIAKRRRGNRLPRDSALQHSGGAVDGVAFGHNNSSGRGDQNIDCDLPRQLLTTTIVFDFVLHFDPIVTEEIVSSRF